MGYEEGHMDYVGFRSALPNLPGEWTGLMLRVTLY